LIGAHDAAASECAASHASMTAFGSAPEVGTSTSVLFAQGADGARGDTSAATRRRSVNLAVTLGVAGSGVNAFRVTRYAFRVTRFA